MTDGSSAAGNVASMSVPAISSMMASRISVGFASSPPGAGTSESAVYSVRSTVPSGRTCARTATTPLARGSSPSVSYSGGKMSINTGSALRRGEPPGEVRLWVVEPSVNHQSLVARVAHALHHRHAVR